jgi:hypothetical protein
MHYIIFLFFQTNYAMKECHIKLNICTSAKNIYFNVRFEQEIILFRQFASIVSMHTIIKTKRRQTKNSLFWKNYIQIEAK